MKVIIFLIKFLFIGALFIVSNENLYLNNQEDFSSFYDMFFSWLSNLSGHVLKIAGYVVNSEWLPRNEAQDSSLEILGQ